jgi:hypothetical protein
MFSTTAVSHQSHETQVEANPIINEELKRLIEEKGLAPNQAQQSDIQSWLKDWISFCLQALQEGLLNETFKRMLDYKISQKSLGQLQEGGVYQSSSMFAFLADLLSQCNKAFEWFDQQTINQIDLDQFIHDHSKDFRFAKGAYEIVNGYYDAYCHEWIESRIKRDDETQKDLFYKNTFDVFWQVYNIGFFSDYEYQRVIEANLKENTKDQLDKMVIKQDNREIIGECFLDFLKKNGFVAKDLTWSQEGNFIKSIVDNALPDIEAHQKTNQIFNNSLWQFINNSSGLNTSEFFGLLRPAISKQQQLQNNLCLTLNRNNPLVSKNKDKIIHLIAKAIFETIEITYENEVIFSYNRDKGILINEHFFDVSQALKVGLLTHVYHDENEVALSSKENAYRHYSPLDLEWRLHQLAIHVIDNNKSDEFSLDNKVLFSQLGEPGIKAYLSELNRKFVKELEQNKLDKGYVLYLPKNNRESPFSRLKLDTLQGINAFLNKQLDGSNESIFCCHSVTIYLDTSHQDDTSAVLPALCEFILLLDKTKLNQLTINLTHLEPCDIDMLSKTLRAVEHTMVRFDGLITTEQALLLESINDVKRQAEVTYHYRLEKEEPVTLKHDISKQPTVVSLAKINALKEKEIHLRPIQGKIGYQNQHHYEQQTEQKTEVNILQSWQIEQAKETKHQSDHGYGILFGDEQASLISWQHIEAAFDSKHPNHEASRLKLGEEILNYQYKGRNLIDLWQRITGDVGLTKQDAVRAKLDSMGFANYSPFIPKQISYKTLLTIVRHPHLFQDGLHLESLPQGFRFHSLDGALFTEDDKVDEEVNLFAPYLSNIPEVSHPSALHFQYLANSAIPSQSFFSQLTKSVSSYHAWQYWRRGFVALNRFNQQGIEALNEIVEDCMQGMDQGQERIDYLNYVIQALNYYHYLHRGMQQEVLVANLVAFEYQQQKNYQQGVANSLSTSSIQCLPKEIREGLHKTLVNIMNRQDVRYYNDDKNDAYINVLLSTLIYHQEKLPNEIKQTPLIKQDTLLQLLTIIEHCSGMKLMELALSHDSSVVYNVFTMLQAIHQTWGEAGLADFNRCFLSPTINLAPLAEPHNQKAFEQLLQLSEVEYHWWQQLTLQHVEQSGFADFGNLMTTFQHFLDELNALNLDNALYMPCPLQGIVNLQVDLNRVLSILKKARRPAEQFRNLAGLDWRACGVIYASQEIKYQFISADMRLNLAYESKYSDFNSQHKVDTYHRQFDHYNARPFSSSTLLEIQDAETKQQLFEFTTSSFFRYIGCQKYTAPMLVYQQFLDAIALPENYIFIDEILSVFRHNDVLQKEINRKQDVDALVLNLLPAIIAYATTGRRGLDRLPKQQDQRTHQLKRFIALVYECARERCFDAEMDQFLLDNHAVAYKKLELILKECISINPHADYFKDAEDIENKNRLDLEELTLLLEAIKKSIDDYYQIQHHNPDLLHQIKDILDKEELKISTWWKDLSHQLFCTKELFEKYDQYIIDAIHRIHDYNQQSNYACFLIACIIINKYSFSFENNGRLMRIMSLVNFKIEHFCLDFPTIISFIQKLHLYQEKAGIEALDKLLSTLTCMVPNANSTLNMDTLQVFVEHCLSLVEHDETVDLSASIQVHFKDYHIDPYLVEVKDADFYPGPSELDRFFPGLGQFYNDIKAVVLHSYPVSLGENKQLAWQDFLSIIHQLKSSEQQHSILSILLQSKHETMDLITLNRWLSVLLKQSTLRARFQPEYFTSLSHVLLNHENKQTFIDTLNKWLDYSDYLPASSHLGFIYLLNKIATIDQGYLCLENLYHVARSIVWMSSHNTFSCCDDVIKLINTWQCQALPIEALNDVLMTLNKFFDMASKSEKCHAQLSQALVTWLANSEHTFDLILGLIQHWSYEHLEEMCNHMLILAQVTSLDLAWVHESLLKIVPMQLTQLAACYQSKPLPDPALLKYFLEGRLTLEAFIAQHTRDPHHERDEKKLKKQFDNEVLWPYLNRAKYLQPNESMSLDFGELLYAQLKFVNQVGKDEISNLSLSDIRQRLHDCKESLAQANSKEASLLAYLTALSLVREAVYKTSQAPGILWLSTVQMLAILSALNHQLRTGLAFEATPLFMQMATGEGKSLLAVMLAILTWLRGDPVTVVTHRASLASRDAEAYAPLFESLGILCQHLTADSYRKSFYLHQWLANNENKPEFSGIYYIEFNDLALIRQQRLLNIGQDINKMSFIVDEGDEIILHNQTDNNLTQTIGDEDTHPHAWVFEVLAAYLERFDARSDSLSVRVLDLLEYLKSASPLAIRMCEQVDFLTKLPTYLQAAWQARTLEDKVDFITKHKTKDSDDYYAAVLLNDKPMPPNVTFNGLIQQALHGRLNDQSKKQQLTHYFPLAPETTLYSTMNPEAVLKWMKESGTVIALSATIGSNSELMDMRKNYGFDYIKLPKMQSNLRVDYPIQWCANQEKQMEAIASICTHYTGERTYHKARAILIAVDSIDLAEKIRHALMDNANNFNPHVFHAGIEDITDQTLSKLEHQSGKSGHILIAVSGLINRGFDIKLSSAKQVVEISTYLKDLVDETQLKGRTSRVNQATGLRDKGKFFAVYDLERERRRYPGLEMRIDDIGINPEAFKQRQYFAHYQQESALRLHRQLVGISKNIVQGHFFDVWCKLFENTNVLKEMRDNVMLLFTKALEKINNVIPVDDFSAATQQGTKARHDYNASLLAIYEEALTGMQSLLGELFSDKVEMIISTLLKTMEDEQQELITNHNVALATGANEPGMKIYKQWKPGVKFNAYLDPGKQSMGNYMLGLFQGWLLSDDVKTKIQLEKNALEQKIVRKKDKKTDFLSQLKQMMNIAATNEDLFEHLVKSYHDNKTSPKEAELMTMPLRYKDADEQEVALITREYQDKESITFIHDPLIGQGCHISFTSRYMQSFEVLQEAINQAYEACGITARFDLRITKLDKQDPDLYQVILDFSGHQFDAIDRQELLSNVATCFDVDVQPLFEATYLPSTKAMQTVMLELRNRMPASLDHVSLNLKRLFQRIDLCLPRMVYDEAIFSEVIKILEKKVDILPLDVKECVDALVNYNKDLYYQDHAGKGSKTYAPSFENLATLLENEKKRQALDLINKQLKVLKHNVFSESLLLRQQIECFRQLSVDLVHSTSSDTLESIYGKWKKREIHYQQQDISVYDVMQLRKQKSGLFSANKSPDMFSLCQQIETMIGHHHHQTMKYSDIQRVIH